MCIFSQITNGFVYATLSLNRLARRLLTICQTLRNEGAIQILYKDVLKKRYFSVYFMIVAFISPGKLPKIFFRCKISCEVFSCEVFLCIGTDLLNSRQRKSLFEVKEERSRTIKV